MARALTCERAGPIRHAAAGVDFGGKELDRPDPTGARRAITSLLANGPLPEGATADPQNRTVTLPAGPRSVLVRVEPVRMPSGGLPYAPVAMAHFRSPWAAVVRVSDQAAPDLVRTAVIARLTELAVVAADRAREERKDVTSGLIDGLLTTVDVTGRFPLSPRDTGRVEALKALTEAGGAENTVALGAAAAMGLFDEGTTQPHSMEGNRPLAGRQAAAARIATLQDLDPAAKAAVERVLELAGQQPGQDTLAAIRRERDCERADLRARSDQLITRRTRADQQLKPALDAEFTQNRVVPHVVAGGGWAGVVDYLTLEPSAARQDGAMPPVLAMAAGPGVVDNLGDFRLTQPAMDMELPEAPFQPNDFALDRTDFVTSQAFGRAVGVARALAGMPTYQADLARVEARADATDTADWPTGAGYRLTTVDRRHIYAGTVDLVTGLGPPRIPDTDKSVLAGRTFKDPRTGYRVEFGQDGRPHAFDPADRPWSGPLPEQTAWLLGMRGAGDTLENVRPPFLLDPQGRPTEYRVIDPTTRYSVDPDSAKVFDPEGTPVDPQGLDAGLRRRLGFRPGPELDFRDPRYLDDQASGLSVNPVTGAVVRTADGRPPRPPVAPEVRRRLDALVRAHRVQYGGQNTADAYGPTDTVFVVGGGAGGASEVEQATGHRRTVIWGARRARLPLGDFPRGPAGAVDPKDLKERYDREQDEEKKQALLTDLSFMTGGGYNRRNTLPHIGAYSLDVWHKAIRTTALPTTLQYTTDHRFWTVAPSGTTIPAQPVLCDRIVYTIGQEAGYPGGPAALLGKVKLVRLPGPGGELNGLRDEKGGLRVLGAAGVTGPVVGLVTPAPGDAKNQIAAQARQLPPDARDIQPSIRYHAQRIAEVNRTFGPAL
ncbi:hypothetical protein [Streptomyces sp. SAI-170]|uniref:hypothetical protein n=1 Tax=Streptomyces sp. SAI-170 TaxID=3377729 RepID=UPI003C7C133A